MRIKYFIPIIFTALITIVWLSDNLILNTKNSYKKQIVKSEALLAYGKNEESMKILKKLIVNNPTNADAFVAMGNVYMDENNPKEAIEFFNQALLIDENEEAIEKLIYLFSKLNFYNELYDLVEKYKDLDIIKKNTPLKPIINLKSGTYNNLIEINYKNNSDAKILYTINGEDPTYRSFEFTEPITLKKGKYILKAVAEKNGLLSSITESNFIVLDDKETVTFENQYLESSFRNYYNIDIDEIKTSDCEIVKSILIIGSFIYFDVEEVEIIVDGDYNYESVKVLRNNVEKFYVYLPEGNFLNLDDLNNFTNLESLHIFSQIDLNLNQLINFKNLKNVQLSFNSNILNLDAVNDLEKLEILSLSHNDLYNIPKIIITDLKFLDLSFNSLTDLKNISSLINLKSLNISHNRIANLSDIYKMINLEYLNIAENNILINENIENFSIEKNFTIIK